MAAAWPSGLPCFLFNGYGIAPRSPVLEVDHGLAIRRRQIATGMPREIDVGLILSASQEPDFREFYNVTLRMGTLAFDAPILIEGVMTTRECTFLGDPPAFTPIAHGLVRTNATLLTT